MSVLTAARRANGPGGVVQQPADANAPLLLDYGLVQMKDRKTRRFLLRNDGKYPLDFTWTLSRQSIVGSYLADKQQMYSVNNPAQNGPLQGRSKIEHEAQFWAACQAAVQFKPSFGTIQRGDTLPIEVSFAPSDPLHIEQMTATLRVTNGSSYFFTVTGQGYRPNLHFSWMSHDFGPTFLANPAVKPTDATLLITNKEHYDISFEPVFPPNESLTTDAAPVLLSSQQSREIHFHFAPREARKYQWQLPFEINNLSTINLSITGEGIPVRLDVPTGKFVTLSRGGPPVFGVPNLAPLSPQLTEILSPSKPTPEPTQQTEPTQNAAPTSAAAAAGKPGEKPKPKPGQPGSSSSSSASSTSGAQSTEQTPQQPSLELQLANAISALESGKRLAFDQLRIGQSCTRTFKVVNRNKAPCKLTIAPCLEALRQLAIALHPYTPAEVTLDPKASAEFRFVFSPKQRIRPFVVPVVAISMGQTVPLVSLTGSCAGLEVKFDQSILDFGPVLRGSQLVRHLLIQNSGDLGANFQWETKALQPEFTLEPVRGYIKPGADQEVLITFAPPAIADSAENPKLDILKDNIACNIAADTPDGSSDSSTVVSTPTSAAAAAAQGITTQKLNITFKGSSIHQKPDGAPISFTCPVRDTQKIDFSQNLPPSIQTNRKPGEPMQLQCSVTGDYFSGPSLIEVTPSGQINVPVTYKPMTMTIPGQASSVASPNEQLQPHMGTLFIPLPDGTGILRELQGTALDPSPIDTLNWELRCHQQMPFSVRITNWLKSTARFRVEYVFFPGGAPPPQTAGSTPATSSSSSSSSSAAPVVVSAGSLENASVPLDASTSPQGLILQGPPSVDIAALQDRIYRLSIKAIHEGTSEFFIRFVQDKMPDKRDSMAAGSNANKDTSTQPKRVEYMYYRIKLTSLPATPAEEITLTTTVRRPYTHTITLTNPTGTAANLTSACTATSLTVPQLVSLPPSGQKTVDIIFVPLDTMDETVTLTFSSKETGTFTYLLKLVALPPPPEKSIKFKAALGLDQTQVFRFVNRYSGGPTDFKCTITPDPTEAAAASAAASSKEAAAMAQQTPFTLGLPSSIVQAPPALSASAGVEVAVPVVFEPTAIGSAKATLTVSSDKGGTYSCILVGLCQAPAPQGPITIKANSPGTNITIKNIFNTQTQFTFTVDNPAFVVKSSENVPPKKTAQILVQYKPTNASGSPSTPPSARLTVSCPLASCTWVYYMKGTN